MQKRREKTTPFGVNLMRSQVLHWAAQLVGHANYNNGRCAVQLFWAYAMSQIMPTGSAKPALECSARILSNQCKAWTPSNRVNNGNEPR